MTTAACGMEKRTIASKQKKRCEFPSVAAVPTQLEPTTKRIWVSARSKRPSGFFSDALWASTFCSARSRSVVTADCAGGDCPCDGIVRAKALAAGERSGIHGGGSWLRHKRCNRPSQAQPLRKGGLRRAGAEKI